MSFAAASVGFGAALVLLSLAHSAFYHYRVAILAAHESLFVCFYACIIGAVFSAEPGTSPLGDTQFAWLYVLTALNSVRPRAHGVAPHFTLDICASLLFILQAILYPYHIEIVRSYK
ncbi:membrane-associated protein, putative [Bodo saltans]|uniref:Membrane-associated protein, putative n=1 Tax=Bodo saltans TaxID=75058 RepID=A0A0S4JK61_BODSA|nr:membrane-associated protein, putative [Bodo saltans]|eukprot:CUG90496.1 membrane-associated protein, putative [Bodo saltans]